MATEKKDKEIQTEVSSMNSNIHLVIAYGY